MRTILYLLIINGLLWLCYESGERRYWQSVAGCSCPDCIEQYEQDQRRLNTLMGVGKWAL